MSNYSLDTLFNKKIKLKQSKTGYRYSVDPLIVSHFANPIPGSKIIDFGTGCGIIPVVLAYRFSELKITGVEIQKNLAELAKENIINNNLQEIVTIIESDIKAFKSSFIPHSVDMVITNPPYTKRNAGRINPDPEKAIARHEIKITLDELIKAAGELLNEAGEFVIIYPLIRLDELLFVMKKNGINPKRLRLVHPGKNSLAKLALVSGIKNGGKALTTERPLYIYDRCQSYTEEMKKMFE